MNQWMREIGKSIDLQQWEYIIIDFFCDVVDVGDGQSRSENNTNYS